MKFRLLYKQNSKRLTFLSLAIELLRRKDILLYIYTSWRFTYNKSCHRVTSIYLLSYEFIVLWFKLNNIFLIFKYIFGDSDFMICDKF